MSLSDKREDMKDFEEAPVNYWFYFEKDIKEAIKELKEGFRGQIIYNYTNINKLIDKIFGDKLTSQSAKGETK